MKKYLLMVFIAVIGLTLIPIMSYAQLASSAWPTYKKDMQRSGLTTVKNQTDGVLLWTADIGGKGPANGGITIGPDNELYLLQYTLGGEPPEPPGHVISYNSNGTIRWTSAVTFGNGCWGGVTVGSNDTLYVIGWGEDPGAGDHTFAALNAADGTMKWSLSNVILAGGDSIPSIGPDGTIYTLEAPGWYSPSRIYSISDNGTYGSVNWSMELPKEMYAGLCLDQVEGKTVIYVTQNLPDPGPSVPVTDPGLFAIRDDGSTGTLLWSVVTNMSWNSPTVSEDGTTVYHSAFADIEQQATFWAINASDGSVKWTMYTGNNHFCSPSRGPDGTLYVGSHGDRVTAITDNGSSGTIKWVWQAPGTDEIAQAIAILGDGTLYVVSSDGNVYSVTDNGSGAYINWQYSVGPPVTLIGSPAVGLDGTLYVATTESQLFAFREIGENVKIITTSMPGGYEGESYEKQVVAVGGTKPYGWAIISGSLPSGLNLDSGTGIIAGMPTAVGKYSFTVQVTDAGTVTDSKGLTIDIVPVPMRLAPGLKIAELGKPYSDFFDVREGSGSFTFSVTGGSTGEFTLNSTTGEITGTPTSAGETNFEVTIDDGYTTIGRDISVTTLDPSLWQCFQNTRRNIGTSVTPGPVGFSIKWSYPHASIGGYGPAIDTDGTLYWGASWPINTTLAINPDGTKKWEGGFSTWEHLVGVPFIGLTGVSANKVYQGGSGYVLALDKTDGSAIWTTADKYTHQPVVSDMGIIYVGKWNDTMYGLLDNGATHSLLWTGEINWDCRSSPALYSLADGADIIVYGGRGGKLLAYREYLVYHYYLWAYIANGSIDTAPVIDSTNNVYIGAMNRGVVSVDGTNGQENWAFNPASTNEWFAATGALSYDQTTLYMQSVANWTTTAGTGQLGKLYALNTEYGVLKWVFDTDNYGWDEIQNCPIVDKAGRVYVTASKYVDPWNRDNTVFCIEDKGSHGSVVWTKGMPSISAEAGGALSIGSDGTLYLAGKFDGTVGLFAIESPAPVAAFTNIIVNAVGNVEITWSSEAGKTYDVVYADGIYDEASLIWTPAATGIVGGAGTTTWEDTTARPVPGGRYYKVRRSGTGVYTTDTVGIYTIQLRNKILSGLNYVATPFVPYDSSLDAVLGNQLPGSTIPAFATQCWNWNINTLSFERAYYDGTTWKDVAGGAPTFNFDADKGYRLLLTPVSLDLTALYFVGKISTVSRSVGPIKSTAYSALNYLGSAYPCEVPLDESGLVESGFTGSPIFAFSDQLWFWNWNNLVYDRIYYNTTASEWRDYPAETATTRKLKPGEGFRLLLSPISGLKDKYWEYPKPYEKPPN